ncbi:Uncharacterised protein [Neisseria gonorrhoeae]|uniref:Uncharacterized protein n=1 Tax=Neisseria gonorrhoeae TaxID=485 RepID=A0A378VZ43_NEIGO|nr:Uncharacterised protein [Neisseria gonorrhoeae]
MAIYLQWDVIISVFNVIIVLRLLTFRTQLDSFYTLSWNNEYILNTQFTNANFNTVTIGIRLVTFFTGNETGIPTCNIYGDGQHHDSSIRKKSTPLKPLLIYLRHCV